MSGYNERSWAIDVIVEIDRIVSAIKRPIQKAGGERTLRSKEGSLFPDILLYGDESCSTTLQGWELKMPDTPITDQEFIDNASKKAKTLNLNSFLLWNVTSAILYVEDFGGKFSPKKSWLNIVPISTRSEVEAARQLWKTALKTILNELNDFFENGTLRGRTIVESFSQGALVDIIFENTEPVANLLKEAVKKNSFLDAAINNWWQSIKSEHVGEKTPWGVLAKINLMNWVNKIIFANVLKSFSSAAFLIESINDKTPPTVALDVLRQISTQCNFLNIFQKGMGEEILTYKAWSEIKQLNYFVAEKRFEAIDQALLHDFLQSTVYASKRKVAGQYVTPPPLADLLLRILMRDKEKTIYDPFCGSGTIPRAGYELKMEYEINAATALGQVWASDKFSFPLQLATIALIDPRNMGCITHVFKSDIIHLAADKEIVFSDPSDGREVKEKLPRFDYIASNFPFVKQKDLEKANPEIKNINLKIQKTSNITNGLDGKSDLFAYLPFYLFDLLLTGGRLGIITSNAWLGTKWGEQFRKILINFFHIEKVVISGQGRWFKNADVVTTLIFLNKREVVGKIDPKEKTAFYVLHQPIEIWGANKSNCKNLASQILCRDTGSQLFSIKEYLPKEISRLEAMGLQWSSFFSNLDFINKISERLVPVRNFFDIGRGERRGWDPLFFPEGDHGIEQNYLKRVLKSSKEIETLTADSESEAFCCSLSLEQLQALNHMGAYRWIKKFESETNEVGKPLTQSLARKGMYWYEMDDTALADLVALISSGQRLFVAKMQTRAFVNQRLIPFIKKSTAVDIDVCHALLNSILGIFYIEALGFGRGLGVLDSSATKLKENLRMLDPNFLNSNGRAIVLEKFKPLLQRDILPLEEELGMPDREDFDKTLLRLYGIESAYYEIKEALVLLYAMRHSVKT